MKKSIEVKKVVKKPVEEKAKSIKATKAIEAQAKKDVRSVWIKRAVHEKIKVLAKKERTSMRAIIENLFLNNEAAKKDAKKAAKVDKAKAEL